LPLAKPYGHASAHRVQAATRNRLSILLLVFVAGTALRLWGLTVHPFWLDEAYSANAVDHGLRFIWRVMPNYEAHPPLYYSLLSLWSQVFGTSLTALRALGLAAGFFTLASTGLAAQEAARALGRPVLPTILAGVAFAAVSPELIAMTQEVRTYPIMILVFSVGVWSVLRLARAFAERGSFWNAAFAAYLACLALMPWLHNMGVLFSASMGLALIVLTGIRSLKKQDWAALITGHALVGLVYLPAFLMMRAQAAAWATATWLHFDPGAVPDQLAETYGLGGLAGLAMAVALILLAFRPEKKGRQDVMLAFAICALLPVLLSILISMTALPVFLQRTLSPVGVPLAILIAIAATGHRYGRVLGIGLFALMLATSVLSKQLPARQDWKGAIAFIARDAQPGDRVYAYPNDGALPFRYAARDNGLALPVRAIPGDFPSDDPDGSAVTGTRGVLALPQARLAAIAGDSQSSAARTIWLLRLGRGFDQGDALLNALKVNRVQTGRWQKGAIDIIRLEPKAPPSTQTASPKQP
jgi:mannosyltransferase